MSETIGIFKSAELANESLKLLINKILHLSDNPISEIESLSNLAASTTQILAKHFNNVDPKLSSSRVIGTICVILGKQLDDIVRATKSIAESDTNSEKLN